MSVQMPTPESSKSIGHISAASQSSAQPLTSTEEKTSGLRGIIYSKLAEAKETVTAKINARVSHLETKGMNPREKTILNGFLKIVGGKKVSEGAKWQTAENLKSGKISENGFASGVLEARDAGESISKYKFLIHESETGKGLSISFVDNKGKVQRTPLDSVPTTDTEGAKKLLKDKKAGEPVVRFSERKNQFVLAFKNNEGQLEQKVLQKLDIPEKPETEMAEDDGLDEFAEFAQLGRGAGVVNDEPAATTLSCSEISDAHTKVFERIGTEDQVDQLEDMVDQLQQLKEKLTDAEEGIGSKGNWLTRGGIEAQIDASITTIREKVEATKAKLEAEKEAPVIEEQNRGEEVGNAFAEIGNPSSLPVKYRQAQVNAIIHTRGGDLSREEIGDLMRTGGKEIVFYEYIPALLSDLASDESLSLDERTAIEEFCSQMKEINHDLDQTRADRKTALSEYRSVYNQLKNETLDEGAKATLMQRSRTLVTELRSFDSRISELEQQRNTLFEGELIQGPLERVCVESGIGSLVRNFIEVNKGDSLMYDICCNKETQITSTLRPDQFIHANRHEGAKTGQSYVMAQYPLDQELYWESIMTDSNQNLLVNLAQEGGIREGSVDIQGGTRFDENEILQGDSFVKFKDLDKSSEAYQQRNYYWPRNSGEVRRFGVFEVANTKVEKKDGYEVLTLQVMDTRNPGETKEITMINCTKWGDYGTGGDDMVESMIQDMQECDPNQEGTIRVNCRAGVGRTGTLVALYEQRLEIDQGVESGTFNPENHNLSALTEQVQVLREARGSEQVVQTAEQFAQVDRLTQKFVHEAAG